MNSRYAYYLSGTLVPPAVDDTYAYFGVEPQVPRAAEGYQYTQTDIQFLMQAYLGIRMNGNVILRYESDRKKIIDTLS